MKDIHPDTAEYVAKYWSPATMDYPMEHKIRFMRDIMAHSDLLGAYTMDNHDFPVAW